MKKSLYTAAAILLSLTMAPAQAALRVLATTPEWAALTRELGGDKVDVYAATSAFQDVHRVDATPSLVARARNADMVVAAGAELEVGWLPILLRESGNARIQPGNPGYFEADANLRLLEVPSTVDRSMGDVHPQGNPHAHLDARNVAIVATALTTRLMAVDGGAAQGHASGGNPPRSGVPVPLAGPHRSGRDRAQARRAAEQQLPRGAGDPAQRGTAEDDPAQCLQ